MQFTPVLALCDPFGVDVPLNLDIPPPPPIPVFQEFGFDYTRLRQSQFSCRADGLPKPDITWRHQGINCLQPVSWS